MDAELRKLERNYAQDPSEENRARLNAYRIKVGQAIIRDPNYVLAWAGELYDWFIQAQGDLLAGPLSLEEGEEIEFDFRPLTMKYSTNMSVSVTWTEEEPSVPVMEIEIESPLPVLSTYPGFQIRFIVVDQVVRIEKPRPEPPNWGLRSAYTENITLANTFTTFEDFWDVVKQQYITDVEDRWQYIISTPIGVARRDLPELFLRHGTQPMSRERRQMLDNLFRNAFISIIDASILLKKQGDLLKPGVLLNSVITTPWFQRSLDIYTSNLERALRSRDIVFDSESSWVSLVVNYNKYYLEFEAGYNETVDSEDFDKSEPSGERYGSVSDLVSQVDDVLENATHENWDLEWSYEEPPDLEAGEVAITLKGEMRLTITVLMEIARLS